jgi:metal transporter CNNM
MGLSVGEGWADLDEQAHVVYPIVCLILLLLSGMCSGLTIGIFSVDVVDMRLQVNTAESDWERKRAKRLVWLLEHGNQTLVSLLVANTICMTALPIMLERMVGELIALIMAVSLLLLFGEVLPQATFVRHNVAVCSALAPFVWIAFAVTFPLTYPLSLVLDRTVGSPDSAVTRDTVAGAVARALEAAETGTYGGMAPHEVRVMRGAMHLSEQKIGQLQIAKVNSAFMLEATATLTKELTQRILEEGYSRIPVYLGSRQQVIGVLVVKALVALAYSAPRQWRIIELPLREPVRVSGDSPALDLYQAFKTGQSHLAAVYDRFGVLQGFVTLEDVFELVHQCAIRDEADDDYTSRDARQDKKRRDQLVVSVFESLRQSVRERREH